MCTVKTGEVTEIINCSVLVDSGEKAGPESPVANKDVKMCVTKKVQMTK